jgi:hypothetical protein
MFMSAFSHSSAEKSLREEKNGNGNGNGNGDRLDLSIYNN